MAEQALQPASPLRRGRELDVRSDLRDRERELLSAEARVERGDELGQLRLVGTGGRHIDGGVPLQGDQRFAEPGERGLELVG